MPLRPTAPHQPTSSPSLLDRLKNGLSQIKDHIVTKLQGLLGRNQHHAPRQLALETLENRSLLAGDVIGELPEAVELREAEPVVVAEPVAVSSENPIGGRATFTMEEGAIGARVALFADLQTDGVHQLRRAIHVLIGEDNMGVYARDGDDKWRDYHDVAVPMAGTELEIALAYDGDELTYQLLAEDQLLLERTVDPEVDFGSVGFAGSNIRWDTNAVMGTIDTARVWTGEEPSEDSQDSTESEEAAAVHATGENLAEGSSAAQRQETFDAWNDETMTLRSGEVRFADGALVPEGFASVAVQGLERAAGDTLQTTLQFTIGDQGNVSVNLDADDNLRDVFRVNVERNPSQSLQARVRVDGVAEDSANAGTVPTGEYTLVMTSTDDGYNATITRPDGQTEDFALVQGGVTTSDQLVLNVEGPVEIQDLTQTVITAAAESSEQAEALSPQLHIAEVHGPNVLIALQSPHEQSTVVLGGGGMLNRYSFDHAGGSELSMQLLTFNAANTSGTYTIELFADVDQAPVATLPINWDGQNLSVSGANATLSAVDTDAELAALDAGKLVFADVMNSGVNTSIHSLIDTQQWRFYEQSVFNIGDLDDVVASLQPGWLFDGTVEEIAERNGWTADYVRYSQTATNNDLRDYAGAYVDTVKHLLHLAAVEINKIRHGESQTICRETMAAHHAEHSNVIIGLKGDATRTLELPSADDFLMEAARLTQQQAGQLLADHARSAEILRKEFELAQGGGDVGGGGGSESESDTETQVGSEQSVEVREAPTSDNTLFVVFYGSNQIPGEKKAGFDQLMWRLDEHYNHTIRFRSGDNPANEEGIVLPAADAFIEAKNEIENYLEQHSAVTNVVIIGYSWGGGMTFRTSHWITNESNLNVNIVSTIYVDAITHGYSLPEHRLPPGTQSMLNIYQSKSEFGLINIPHGSALSPWTTNSIGSDDLVEIDLDAVFNTESHASIDEAAITIIEQFLIDRIRSKSNE